MNWTNRFPHFFKKERHRGPHTERYFDRGLIYLAILMVINTVFLVGIIFLFPDWNEVRADKGDKNITSISVFEGEEIDNSSNSLANIAMADECYYYGSFMDADKAKKMKQTVDFNGKSSVVREIEINVNPDYMVYINRRLKVSDLKQLLEELRSRSVDGAIVARSSHESVLSLGLFSELSEAKEQKKRVSELGYPAEIETINRSYRLFSLQVIGPRETKTKSKMVLNVPCSAIAENL